MPKSNAFPHLVLVLCAMILLAVPQRSFGQAAAINAVLFEAYARPYAIAGFYVRRYNPLVALQDRSASVNGKPAQLAHQDSEIDISYGIHSGGNDRNSKSKIPYFQINICSIEYFAQVA
jgi:hypothetical protein